MERQVNRQQSNKTLKTLTCRTTPPKAAASQCLESIVTLERVSVVKYNQFINQTTAKGKTWTTNKNKNTPKQKTYQQQQQTS